MTFSHRLPRFLFAAAVVLPAAAGCSSPADAEWTAPVPRPPAAEATLCHALHKELPGTAGGLDRNDPAPDSELTAGWGDGAIVLRCGVPRPPRMNDPQANAVEADGVDWLVEQRPDSGPRLTTTYRKAYVEVSLDKRYAHDVTPLADLAAAVRGTIPSTL
ncbi:DUF3515 domain-containing protein [Streptomyces sp. LP05-1]|uniref:DUF3515 domain-containing protein n=1 Tax=Streptomyces pyxinae TaxID=2970734 RepID=A0ABT2CGU0_9ACTN|nr:DUF3515 domain-containing protein [Streptomyces sp. LP05-1]MCS0636606.1 DUF3515 domain-containing protein [Streptomyces sp. LP05-1]